MKALLAALLLIASPIWALTPQEVLEDWQGFSERNLAGFAFERQEGNAGEITLYDVTLGGGVRPVLPWLKLTSLPDGTVEITTASAFRWESGADGYLDNGQVDLTNLSLHASGPQDNISFQFSVDRFAQYGTSGIQAFLKDIDIQLTGLSGTLRHSVGDELRDHIFIELRATDWHSKKTSSSNTTVAMIEYSGLANFAFSGLFNMAHLDENRFTFTSGKAIQSQDGGENFRNLNSADSINIAGNTLPEAPEIDVEIINLEVSSQFPTPLMPSFAYTLGTFRLTAAIQGRALGATYPWRLNAELQALELSPETWALYDPESTLPHGLGQLDLSLNGTGQIPDGRTGRFPRLLFMWPTELKTLNLTRLEIDFSGLSLLASGHVNFGEIRSPFAPPPTNGGEIDLQMQGAQKLLKALETGPLSTPFLESLLNASTPAGQSPDDLDVQILFDETGGISVE